MDIIDVAWSLVLATSVPALLDIVNSVKNSQSFFTDWRPAYVLMSQITTLVVGVNVNLVAGSRPLFFGLVRLTHLVWQPNAVVKGCNSALWQGASGKQTLARSWQMTSLHLFWPYEVNRLSMRCTSIASLKWSVRQAKVRMEWAKYAVEAEEKTFFKKSGKTLLFNSTFLYVAFSDPYIIWWTPPSSSHTVCWNEFYADISRTKYK